MSIRNIGGSWLRLLTTTLLWTAGMVTSQADVALDGTTGGAGGPLTGSNFVIDASVGKTVNTNLFHSFSEFNLTSAQSATFTGPAAIENILGRITGGSASSIDGVVRSTIPDANLFLLNPNGILFGPNATLEIQGSFHASTGDYIALADGTQFTAQASPQDAQLTSAAPEAFGFLDASPDTIAVDRSELIVGEGETLSLVGGDLTMTGGLLEAPSGRVNFASLASAAEIPVNIADLNTETVDALGEVSLSPGAQVNVSGGDGDRGGTVAIRGGRLMVSDTTVSADTRGTTDGAATGIDVQVAQDVVMTNGTEIRSDTFAEGNAGNIKIRANRIMAKAERKNVVVGSRVQEDQVCGTVCGNAGDVEITAGTVELIGGRGEDFGEEGEARIESSALENSTGNAGSVTVIATERVTISGEEGAGFFSNAEGAGNGGRVFVSVPTLEMSIDGEIQASTSGPGDAGVIDVRVGRLKMTSGAGIESRAETGSTGKAGMISVIATDRVTITGLFVFDEEENETDLESTGITATTRGRGDGGQIFLKAPVVELVDSGSISAGTFAGRSGDPLPPEDGKGNAGAIELEVDRLTLTGGSNIGSRSGEQFGFVSMGDAGTVTIAATELITIDGQGFVDDEGTIGPSRVTTLTEGVGRGGDIEITTPVLTLSDGGTISTESRSTGPAGDIRIQVSDTFESINNGRVRAAANQSGGGNIEVSAGRLVHLVDSEFSTAVRGGAGMAGNISIDPEFVVFDNSQIIANAFGGPGGNISIVAGNFFATPNSVIDASSAQNIDGTVDIDSPDTDIAAGISQLPASFLDAGSLLPESCVAQRRVRESSFVVAGPGGMPIDPDGYLPSFHGIDPKKPTDLASSVQNPSFASETWPGKSDSILPRWGCLSQ